MDSARRTPHPRAKLFDSPLLERLTVLSVRRFVVLWAVLLPAIAIAGILVAPVLWAPLLMLAGVLFWTVTEYALHRYVFHFRSNSDLMRRATFIIHGNHHADPNDPLRNLMPPIVSIPVGGLIWALAWWVFGPAGTWFFFGFMSGYVAYDLVHYACHQKPMKGPLGRMLKAHHMRHHHSRTHGNYAITGIIWDRVFSTRIATARDGIDR